MKYIIFLFLNFAILNAQNPLDKFYAQQPDGKNELRYKDSSRVVFSKARGHLHGMYYQFYANGQVAVKAKLDNGKYCDSAWSYHQNGKVKSVDFFKFDTLVYSRWDWYYDNGNLADSELLYMDTLGIDIGTKKYGKFKENNFLVYDVISDRRSDFKKLKGCVYVHLAYYKDGANCSRKELLSNKRDGIQLTYYRNGNICSNENYRKGKREGKQYFFDTNGQTSEECYEGGMKKACY